MREHAELEVEEVGGLGVAVLLRLVDLVPDVVDVGVDDLADSFEVVAAVVEVPQHEQ